MWVADYTDATDGESCGSLTIQMLTHIRLVCMYRMVNYGSCIQDTF